MATHGIEFSGTSFDKTCYWAHINHPVLINVIYVLSCFHIFSSVSFYSDLVVTSYGFCDTDIWLSNQLFSVITRNFIYKEIKPKESLVNSEHQCRFSYLWIDFLCKSFHRKLHGELSYYQMSKAFANDALNFSYYFPN